MAHRELRPDERCERSPLTGAHTWEFVTEKQKEKRATVTVERVQCLHCQKPPKRALRERLEHERELDKECNRIAKALHKAQKEATGTQIAGRKSA